MSEILKTRPLVESGTGFATSVLRRSDHYDTSGVDANPDIDATLPKPTAIIVQTQTDELWNRPWTTRRRWQTVDPSEGVPVAWPATADQQRRTFENWETAAISILRGGRSGFGMVIALRKVILSDGTVRATNVDLARASGWCCTKTAARELRLLRILGLITVETGWFGGLPGRRRIIRLSLPTDRQGDAE